MFKDWREISGNASVPLPDGCHVPHAIFARKYQLVSQSDSLSSYLPISQMPIAESKATETLVEAASSGHLHNESAWHFRGPFTPQLGYDGGLDFRWTLCEPTLEARTFDSDMIEDEEGFQRNEAPRSESLCGNTKGRTPSPTVNLNARAKRRGFHFGLDTALDWLSGHHSTTIDGPESIILDKNDSLRNGNGRRSPPVTPPISEGSPTNGSSCASRGGLRSNGYVNPYVWNVVLR